MRRGASGSKDGDEVLKAAVFNGSNQQGTRRRPLFEPAMIAAIDLHQLAYTGPAIARLMNLGRALFARNPQAGVPHPAPHRLLGQLETMALAQLLAGQRRPKIGIALTDQRHGAHPDHDGQLPVAHVSALR